MQKDPASQNKVTGSRCSSDRIDQSSVEHCVNVFTVLAAVSFQAPVAYDIVYLQNIKTTHRLDFLFFLYASIFLFSLPRSRFYPVWNDSIHVPSITAFFFFQLRKNWIHINKPTFCSQV